MSETILTRYVEPNLLQLEDRQFEETADGQRIIRDVVVSTESIDSHRSIIKLDGWDLNRYSSNPVLDWMHASTGHGRPTPDELIGQALTKMTPGALTADLMFVPDDLSNIAGKVYRQMKARILRGLSVSFLPKEYKWQLEMPDGSVVDEPDLNSDEGFLQYVQMMKAGARDLLQVTKQELVAIGVVMVPSNPDTLSNGIAELRSLNPRRDEARKRAMGDRSPVRVVGGLVSRNRGAVAFEAYPLREGSWDGEAAAGRIRAASTHADGEVDWNRYQCAFGWFDESDPAVFGSYRLVHHDVIDGEWVTVKAGLIQAAAELHEEGGGVPEAERELVRAHLDAHYKEFDMVPPWDAEPTAIEGAGEEGTKTMAGVKAKAKSVEPVAEPVAAPAAEPVAEPVAPAANGANREITEEVKTNAMKAGAVCVDAITVANNALEAGDEEVARKACEDAAGAADKCREAYASISPMPEAEDEGTAGEGGAASVEPASVVSNSIGWVKDLTGKEDEPSQRGTVEAWQKAATELVEARATIAKLEKDLGLAKNGSLEEQMRTVLDKAERKLTPAERKSYEARHYKVEGEERTFVGTESDLAWLRSHMDALPERAELAPAAEQPPKPAGDVVLTEEERSVAKQFRMTPEQFIEHKRAMLVRDGVLVEDEDE